MSKQNKIAGKEITFQSKMENWEEGMDYCAIAVPASVTKALGTTAAVLVMARVNASKPFKVSLFPVGGGKHFIRVRKKVRTEANLKDGDRVKVHIVVLDRDKDAKIPKDLEKALKDQNALKGFKTITPGARNFILRKIDDASKPETRAKRIQEAVKAALIKAKTI